MNEPISIRRAGPRDAAAVLAMVRELAAHEDSLEHVSVDQGQWHRHLGNPDIVVLLAHRADEPVGYVSALRRPYLWGGCDLLALDDLYVRERARNAGVGGRLMRGMAEAASRDGLLVRWEVQPDNAAGLRFHARLGARLFNKTIASWRAEDHTAWLKA